MKTPYCGVFKASYKPETTKLEHHPLAEPTQVEIRIFAPDGGLIRTLADGADQTVSRAQHAWDGRDDTGKIVPDEAYTFVIKTAAGAVYDPTTFSGGEVLPAS